MNWLLLVVLTNGNLVMERFPNEQSCDSIKTWTETYAGVSKVACLPDLEEPRIDEPVMTPIKTDDASGR